MKNLLEKFKRNSVGRMDSPLHETQDTSRTGGKADRFTIVSWVATLIVVASLLGGTLYYKGVSASSEALEPIPTAAPEQNRTEAVATAPVIAFSLNPFDAIQRALQLKTNAPERPRYEPITYRVAIGDSMWGISDKFKVKSETILFANEQLNDDVHSLKPGIELIIPPVDGLYYVWNEGDTIEAIAQKFKANPEDIINFPGNHIDLTNPIIAPGTNVMIPGGTRKLNPPYQKISSSSNDNVCGGGPIANGFGWPANSLVISGNPYSSAHPGIDITANEGDPVYAAGSGVVIKAQGGWNYGYGNVVYIDHGNGYVTIYAHLSQINVSVCTTVGQGAVIGLAGNTGNSFGAHLHFEIHINGTPVNPAEVLQ